MHSRIFQVSREPIDKEDYIDESNYYDHWFTNLIADCVNGDTDRGDDVKWLKECYEKSGLSFGKDSGGEYFIIDDKAKYFKPKFEEFCKALDELKKITLEDFSSNKCNMPVYLLKGAHNDKFGFYIDSDETSLRTLDEFVRYADIGIKYYIGVTIDYHW